jgi:hypothetical protein
MGGEMSKMLVVIAAAALVVCPALGYAQYDSSDSGPSGQSYSAEEAHMQSNLSSEMASQEAGRQTEQNQMEESMAGNSESQQAATEQADY